VIAASIVLVLVGFGLAALAGVWARTIPS